VVVELDLWNKNAARKEIKMKNSTVKIDGITLDVHYIIEKVKDPLSTGDSPTEFYLDIDKICSQCESTDLSEILTDSFKSKIEDRILEIERGDL
jgi:hypothetical protein